ncbi:phage tail assembly chaperone G [Numidum massiliense]|uniref:phage tail assembly chaperone G n=1 Tax=Numidum massiliense TaxID=1522315 RepID=UPI0006D589C1|nr:hypothetical protein [Numidum massiliense]
MEITLRIDGEDKTFVQEFVPLKFYRKALEIEKYAAEPDSDEFELLDRRLRLIVEIFDKQFTKDHLENGLNTINHGEVIYDIIGVGVLGYAPLDELEQQGKYLMELQQSQSTNE